MARVDGRNFKVSVVDAGVCLEVYDDGWRVALLNHSEATVAGHALIGCADLVERAYSAVPRETIRALLKALQAGKLHLGEIETALELLAGGEE